MNVKTKKLTMVAMLSAMAYILMFISKIIPAVQGFLQYDAKDVVITMGGFILGPVYALLISVVVSVLEFFTVSSTGPIGLIMNIISTAAFSYTASVIYKKNKKLSGAFLSLGVATITLTVVMLLWNYYITPIYMKIPREVIIPMLPTVFLPFNLVKGLINSGFILFTYKPVVSTLQNLNLSIKTNNEQDQYLTFWQVLVFIVLPTFIIQFVLNSNYRLATILGSTLGASITTYIMAVFGFLMISKIPLTSHKTRKAIAILIGFVLYYISCFIVFLFFTK